MNRFTLFLASTHKICYIMRRKREAREAVYPNILSSCFINSRHYSQEWRLFSFSLENRVAQSNKGANELRGFAYFEIFFYKSVSKGVSVFYFISENCSGTPINKHSSDYFSSTT